MKKYINKNELIYNCLGLPIATDCCYYFFQHSNFRQYYPFYLIFDSRNEPKKRDELRFSFSYNRIVKELLNL